MRPWPRIPPTTSSPSSYPGEKTGFYRGSRAHRQQPVVPLVYRVGDRWRTARDGCWMRSSPLPPARPSAPLPCGFWADTPSRARLWGADKGDDTADFVAGCRRLVVRSHVAQKQRRSAIDGRTRRPAGYWVSLQVRKRSEESFGWLKTIWGLRQTLFIGQARQARSCCAVPLTTWCASAACPAGGRRSMCRVQHSARMPPQGGKGATWVPNQGQGRSFCGDKANHRPFSKGLGKVNMGFSTAR